VPWWLRVFSLKILIHRPLVRGPVPSLYLDCENFVVRTARGACEGKKWWWKRWREWWLGMWWGLGIWGGWQFFGPSLCFTPISIFSFCILVCVARPIRFLNLGQQLRTSNLQALWRGYGSFYLPSCFF
jgi:hypothetical protein